MAIPGIPFKATATGIDPVGSMTQGQSFISNLIAQHLENLKSKEMEAKLPYASKQALAELLKTQAETPYLQAQTGKLNKETQYYDDDILSQIGLRKSQIPLNQSTAAMQNLYTRNPLLKQTGLAGAIGAQIYLQQQGNQGGQPGAQINQPAQPEAQPIAQPGAIPAAQPGQSPQVGNPAAQPSNFVQMMQQNIANEQRRKIANTNLTEQNAAGWNWEHLPIDTKRGTIAQLMAMGVEPSQGIDLIKQGKSVAQIAHDQGFDPENLPAPQFFPTSGNITQNIKTAQAEAEINYLSGRITPLIKPYSGQFMGMNGKLMYDSITGKNELQFGDFVAGMAMQNELAGGRNRGSGLESGVTMVEQMKKESLAGIKLFAPRITPRAYEQAQKRITEVISGAVRARNAVSMNPYNPNAGQQPSNGDQASEQVTGKVSPGARALANNLVLPNFNTEKDFKEYVSKQDKMTRDAISIKLGWSK